MTFGCKQGQMSQRRYFIKGVYVILFKIFFSYKWIFVLLYESFWWSFANFIPFDAIGVHFQSPKSKFKLKILSNWFLVWILWHLYEWKKKQLAMIAMVLNGKT